MSIRLTAIFLVALALPAHAIDLVPHYTSTMSDGVVIRRVYFADAGKKYAVKLDSETKLGESQGGALFRFDKFPSASMRLRQSPLRAQIAFGADSLERYQNAARELLPPGAEEIVCAEKTPNPLPINNWRSYCFTFSYRVASETRRQSITFLNLNPSEQIVMQTDSSDRDFNEITARAYNIIRRWHEIVPTSETPFN